MGAPLPSTIVAAAADDLARGLAVAGVTALIVVAVVLIAALALLFRRRAGAQPSGAAGLDELRTRANVLLVRADEAVAAGQNELGFAVAQFGEERTRGFSEAVARARADLAEAFRLRHALDDAVPESALKQRELTLHIIALCESAVALLDGLATDFAALRRQEAHAPGRIEELRQRIDAVNSRLRQTEPAFGRLQREYAAELVSPHAGAVDDARIALAAASAALDNAERGLSPDGVNSVAGLLQTAEESVQRAVTRLDAVDRHAAELDAAASALDALLRATDADLAEARAERDAAPDPDSGAGILRAIADIERVRAEVGAAGPPRNPVAGLDRLSAAVAGLDAALASARNQAQRLDHARTALVGTLASAESQISTARTYIDATRRRVGAEARTRVAEAERQLALARLEADPVAALDAARRAVTLARDGDALAHYDALSGGR